MRNDNGIITCSPALSRALSSPRPVEVVQSETPTQMVLGAALYIAVCAVFTLVFVIPFALYIYLPFVTAK